MKTKEICESGFIQGFFSEYIEQFFTLYYFEKDRLLYAFCDTQDERRVATYEEMKRIKKKIRRLSKNHETLSSDFLLKFENEYSAIPFGDGSFQSYCVEQFSRMYIKNLTTLTPKSDYLEELEGYARDVDCEADDPELFSQINYYKNGIGMDDIFVESSLVEQIEKQILIYKKKGSWGIDFEEYVCYMGEISDIDLLFKLCKVLVQLLRFRLFKSKLNSTDEELITNPIISKLEEFGFFNLEMVQILSDKGRSKLIDLISSNKAPYCIAMFDYLGFFKHLLNNLFSSKTEMFVELSKWLKMQSRSVKGNINSLQPHSEEDRSRYTAYMHKEKVENDYKSIKLGVRP